MTNLEFIKSCNSTEELIYELYKRGNLEMVIDDEVCEKCTHSHCKGECILTNKEVVAMWLRQPWRGSTWKTKRQ